MPEGEDPVCKAKMLVFHLKDNREPLEIQVVRNDISFRVCKY